MKTRKEEDSMGSLAVPADLYYGAQTARAMSNFKISSTLMPVSLIQAGAMIKKHAACVNFELGLLKKDIYEAISQAALEVFTGIHLDSFQVEVFQTGSGTSTNMNLNEVIACRANEILTGSRRTKNPVHPNDHVNLGQSSNDVIPSAIHIAALTRLQFELFPSLEILKTSLENKAKEFNNIVKIGRTHLQDAIPMSLGQEFSGYAQQIASSIQRLRFSRGSLSELSLGGTAIGNGLNTHPVFGKMICEKIAIETGISFHEAKNHFESQSAQDAAIETSGALKTLAISLAKIANDLRWLASGPRAGLGEINLPSLQPGSSIMPGKVNPVIPEVVLQVCARVIGNDATITIGGLGGNFELNTMLPIIGHCLLSSIEILTNTVRTFNDLCVVGITANESTCLKNVEQSLSLSTSLAPIIGYDLAAEITKTALETGQTIRQIAKDKHLLSDSEIDDILDKTINGTKYNQNDHKYL